MTSPVDIRPDHLEIVLGILREHLPVGVKVRVFGSRANWPTKNSSDLGLALEGATRLSGRVLSSLKGAFEDSALPYTVDVLDIKRVENPLRRLVESQRKPLILDGDRTELNSSGEWREVTIGEIAEVVGGSTPRTSDPDNFDGDIPWLTPKDLAGTHDRYFSRGARNLSQKGLGNCSAKLLPRGAVLLTTRAPIGYVAIAKNPIATNRGQTNTGLGLDWGIQAQMGRATPMTPERDPDEP